MVECHHFGGVRSAVLAATLDGEGSLLLLTIDCVNFSPVVVML